MAPEQIDATLEAVEGSIENAAEQVSGIAEDIVDGIRQAVVKAREIVEQQMEASEAVDEPVEEEVAEPEPMEEEDFSSASD